MYYEYVFIMWAILPLLAFASAQNIVEPRINVDSGEILGQYKDDGDYIAFYGIYYAGSTSGKHRFKAPNPPEKLYYDNVIAANEGVTCAQPTLEGVTGMEACLVLDVFTKNMTASNPVIVWLEGEEYERSSNITYPIQNLVKEGLVVVSVKYRLSIFGFLCLRVPEAPGNAGLKDVLRALKWVQNYIAQLGGDPHNVMLAGHGSGAAMVDLITLSPLSRNLVHKALVLSGTALAPWAMSYDPIGNAEKVAKKIKYKYNNLNELADLFQTTDYRVLSGALWGFDYYNQPPLFAPCIDGSVVPDEPINILRSGEYNDIPYIAGFTDLEGTIRAHQSGHQYWQYYMNDNINKFLPADLEFKSVADKTNVSKSIQNYYFGNETVRKNRDSFIVEVSQIDEDKKSLPHKYVKVNYIDNNLNFLEFEGHILVNIPIIRGVMERAKTSRSPVRLFQFSYINGTNVSDSKISGVKHGELLNYLFNYGIKKDDNSARRILVSRIANFAKTGSTYLPPYVDWEPITRDSFKMLLIRGKEDESTTNFYQISSDNIYKNETDFWNKIYETHRRSFFVKSSANCLSSYVIITIIAPCIVRILTSLLKVH